MTLPATNGHSFRWLIPWLVSFTLWSGCSLRPLQQQPIGDLVDRHSDSRIDGMVGGVLRRTAEAHETYSTGFPRTEITVLELGEIELIWAEQKTGVVIGAPHGTFDPYTAATVREICRHSGLAGVIASGFTPAETGDGRRINVNRPTERHVALSDREIETPRATATYEQFKNSVLRAARGKLALYIDIHQNSGTRIEVATVRLSKTDARFVKDFYRALRDSALAENPNMVSVELAIEPLDPIEVGAWAAKTNGILAVAERSLHFELPSEGAMASERQRSIYTAILAELIRRISARASEVN